MFAADVLWSINLLDDLLLCVEELVSRLRSSPVYSNIRGYFWLLTLSIGGLDWRGIFFNIPKKVVNVILGLAHL